MDAFRIACEQLECAGNGTRVVRGEQWMRSARPSEVADQRIPRSGTARWFVVTGVVATAGYVLFMVVVDVPMYVRRWRQGRAAKEIHLSIRAGLADAMTRRVVTRAWAIWKPEIAWLTGYFSFAVWASLALVHFPGR